MSTLGRCALNTLTLRPFRGPKETTKRHEETKQSKELSREVSLGYLQQVFDETQHIFSEEKGRVHLDASFMGRMNVTLEDLELDTNGSYAHRYDPCFFEPLQLSDYPIDPQDAGTQRAIARVASIWDRQQCLGMADAHSICSVLERNFHHYARTGPGQDSFPLRQFTGWIHFGINHDEDLEGPICRSFKWTPRTAYRFFAGEDALPHYMITLVHEFPPKEELLHAEMLSITAGMIMQLRDPTLCDHTTMPVMVFSFMGEMKGRILQAYDNQGELVVRKSKLFDFWSWESAEKNFDLFVQFMGSTPVGDTKRVEQLYQQPGVAASTVQPKTTERA